jgi:MFS family permease
MLLALSLFGTFEVYIYISSQQTNMILGTGTVLCGVAPSMNALIAARAIAGMGGGG